MLWNANAYIYIHPTNQTTLAPNFTPHKNTHSYAFDAGMRVGDRLLAVDGVPVKGRTVDQVY